MPNILITSAGRRVSLVEYFKDELRLIGGAGSKVFTTDLHPELSTACRVSDGGFKLGKFSESSYVPDLLNVCKTNEVSMVIPTIDTELLLYAQHRDAFKKEKIELLVSDLPLVKTFRDKRITNQFFIDKGFDIPRLLDKNALTFPLFVKPIDGSSSIDTFKIRSKDEISDSILNNEKLLFMEYLGKEEYEEYTIDLYYTNYGDLRCIVPRLRIETRSGEINKGITRRNELVPFVKERLGRMEGARGCLTLQVFLHKTDKLVYGIEVNPRFGGGYPLSYLAGANYVQWILKEYLQNEPVEWFEKWEENLLLLRHDAEMTVHEYDYK